MRELRHRAIVAFAPTLLMSEFLAAAFRKMAGRGADFALDPETVTQQVLDFLSLDIDYWDASVERSCVIWDYSRALGISPADCACLACAMCYDAELWITHEHADRSPQQARSIYPKVFLLSDGPFIR